MTRALALVDCDSLTGDALPTATVRIWQNAAGTVPISQNLYAASSGGPALTQPISVNTLGQKALYVDAPQRAFFSINGATPVENDFSVPDPITLSGGTADVPQVATGHISGGTFYAPTIWDQTMHWTELEAAALLRKPINLKEYFETLGNNLTSSGDDTAILNAAIRVVEDLPQWGQPGNGATFILSAGFVQVSSWNLTDLKNVEIQGAPGGTLVCCTQQTTTNTADAAFPSGTNRPGIDLRGSSGVTLRGIYPSGFFPGTSTTPDELGVTHLKPSCLVFWGDYDPTNDGAGAYRGCNSNVIDKMGGLAGSFGATKDAVTVAAVVLHNVVDSQFYWLNVGTYSKPNLIIAHDLTSFPIYSQYLAGGPLAGSQPSGNLDFYGIGGHGLIIEGSYGVRFQGGLLDGTNQDSCLKLVRPGTLINQKIQFFGTEFTWGTGGAGAPSSGAIINVTAVAAVHSDSAVKSLHFFGPGVQNAVTASVAFIKGAAGTVIEDLIIDGVTSADFPSNAKVVDIGDHDLGASTVTLKGGHIDLAGAGLDPGGSIAIRTDNLGTYTQRGSANEGKSFSLNPTGDMSATSGLVMQNNALLVPGGTAGSPAVRFLADPDNGITLAGSDLWSLVAGAAAQAQPSTAGLILRRLLGTGLAAAPVLTIHANWGTGATSSIAGTELAGEITIGTPASAGISTNPTITLTWPAAWGTAPFVTIQQSSTPAASNPTSFAYARSTTAAVITCSIGSSTFTPTGSTTYRFIYTVTG